MLQTIFTPVFLNLGYEPNDKFRLLAGLGYGGSKGKFEWSPNHKDTDTIKYRTSTKTRVLAVPVTAQVICLKP